MSAPTLSDIYLPSHVTLVYDDLALEPFYKQVLKQMRKLNFAPSEFISIALHFKEPDFILVKVNGTIFARLSTNPAMKDAKCLVKNLNKTPLPLYFPIFLGAFSAFLAARPGNPHSVKSSLSIISKSSSVCAPKRLSPSTRASMSVSLAHKR